MLKKHLIQRVNAASTHQQSINIGVITGAIVSTVATGCVDGRQLDIASKRTHRWKRTRLDRADEQSSRAWRR
ncbi:MAG TPA: hypothetical protein DDX19_05895 [Rhodopirellula baltica]|uniref:Uncharacterized protein n=1 Tax=Rhodopirellula baltica (strain DSM 10527 / NCIMB 13988 / SH1) TaxID=243090 RepID=Q7UE46_RHOBA|nr:hypothetical protein-transmembrane prediction [Rhodopirellula baltica SH 1]HBE62269.1 hypothetical protein [Rhodopirellula baltica]